MLTVREGADVDIGANASAEGEDAGDAMEEGKLLALIVRHDYHQRRRSFLQTRHDFL
jgi:hypothetical protein